MSRKYRQSGYQDEGTREARSAPEAGRPATEGPRGRGLGKPGRTVFRCRDCGEVSTELPPSPEATCRRCGAALHACVNCAYFDPGSRYECRQPLEERVQSKTKANRCALFSAKLVAELGEGPKKSSDPRAAFDALFD